MKKLGRVHSCFDAGSDTQYLVTLVSYLCPLRSVFTQKFIQTAKLHQATVLQYKNITL